MIHGMYCDLFDMVTHPGRVEVGRFHVTFIDCGYVELLVGVALLQSTVTFSLLVFIENTICLCCIIKYYCICDC